MGCASGGFRGWTVAGQEAVLQGVGGLAALGLPASAPPLLGGGLPGGKAASAAGSAGCRRNAAGTGSAGGDARAWRGERARQGLQDAGGMQPARVPRVEMPGLGGVSEHGQGGGFSRDTGGVAGLSPARLLVVGALLLAGERSGGMVRRGVQAGGRGGGGGGFLVYPAGKREEWGWDV